MTDDLSEHDTTRHRLSDFKRRMRIRDADAELPKELQEQVASLC